MCVSEERLPALLGWTFGPAREVSPLLLPRWDTVVPYSA